MKNKRKIVTLRIYWLVFNSLLTPFSLGMLSSGKNTPFYLRVLFLNMPLTLSTKDVSSISPSFYNLTMFFFSHFLSTSFATCPFLPVLFLSSLSFTILPTSSVFPNTNCLFFLSQSIFFLFLRRSSKSSATTKALTSLEEILWSSSMAFFTFEKSYYPSIYWSLFLKSIIWDFLIFLGFTRDS